ncbi:MAG TPA: DUF1272 domain-containing protein [Candidatus Udaeobacter sp.]|nr:DUF1272 domain-containing protein [Candidatus Udaeobacter sp.]
MPRTQGPQVVDRSSARLLEARPAWGPGLEALLSLVMLGSGEGLERYDRGAELERHVRRGLPPAVSRALSVLRTPAGDPWSALIGVVAAPEQANDLTSVIGRIETIDASQLKLAMMGLHRTQLRGRPARPEELIRIAEREGWAEEVRPVAKVDAAELAHLVLDALRQLPPEIYLSGARTAELLERNALDAQRLIDELEDAASTIERLTHGLVYRPDPGVTEALLIPSLVHRPWTRVLDHGSTKIFCYPARLESELTAPDIGLVAIYRALGDGTRLRILRRLAAGTAPVARMSEELGLAKSTVHEHLLSLRAAGLVRMSAGGGFELQPELPDLNWMLKEFLGLEMRRECEGCGRVLETDGVAFICSYECTFCDECAQRFEHVCPNCGGELVMRPKRSQARAGRRPRARAGAKRASAQV